MDKEKRAFLKGVAATYFGYIILEGTGAILGKFVDEYWEEGSGDPYETDLIHKLFGNVEEDFRFVPGISHYRYPNKPHPDDREAMASLGRLGAEIATKFELVNEVLAPKNVQGNLICLGSPVSNYLSRVAMNYRYVTESDKSQGLVSDEKGRLFYLPYEFSLDAKELLKNGVSIRNLQGGRGDEIPNWSIRDCKTGEYLVSDIEGGNLLSDYLLITVLPNIYDPSAYEKHQKLIIIGGSHGVGTKAIDLVFKNRNVLLSLLRQKENAEYWQAIIKVTDTYFNKKKGRMSPREVSSDPLLRTVHLNTTELKKWL